MEEKRWKSSMTGMSHSLTVPTLRIIFSHSSHAINDHGAQGTGHVSCHIPVCRNHMSSDITLIYK